MRYANSGRYGKGIGVEPHHAKARIAICNEEHTNVLLVRSSCQARELINLLDDACEVLGWTGPAQVLSNTERADRAAYEAIRDGYEAELMDAIKSKLKAERLK